MIKTLEPHWEMVYPPMKHQGDIFELSKSMEYYGYFWEMGTGKTKPILDTIAHLFMTGEIDGVVIISDNGCYLNWPIKEIPKHFPKNIPIRIGTWSSAMKTHEKKIFDKIMVAQDDVLDFLCVNVEAMSTGRAPQIVKEFIDNHYCLMCVDEATSIKNIKSQRTKNVIMLGNRCNYRRIATGTPITQSPLDLFAMCEFLKPRVLGYNSFVGFKADHAIVKQVPSGRWHYDIILGYMNLDKLTESIQPFTSRLTKKECLDLPDKVYETIYVEQTPEQERYYQQLKQTAVLQLEQGLLTSTSAITTIMKLHQINCGHVKIDDKTVIEIPSNRVKVLIETLDKLLPEKVVIWCRFQHDVVMIMRELRELKSENYGVHYYGETSDADRESALRKFQTDVNCKWFVGTAATGGKGIDGLQNVCNYEIYYSNSYDREDRAQSEDRLHRHGQKNQVTIIDMEVAGTVDGKIRDALIRKEDLAFQVLDKFRMIVT